MTTEVSPQEASRIISHMNKEHAESLAHYLEAFGGVSAKTAAINPEITAFTTPSMEISYGTPARRRQWTYKFDPPMLGGQARKRLEEMHKESRKKLGISEVTINSFSPDTTTALQLAWMTGLLLVLTIVDSSTLASWLPPAETFASFVLRKLDIKQTPGNSGLAIKVIFLGTWYFLHLLEVLFALPPIMRRYNMTSRTARIGYTLGTMAIGFPLWKALKREGQRQEDELTAKEQAGKTH